MVVDSTFLKSFSKNIGCSVLFHYICLSVNLMGWHPRIHMDYYIFWYYFPSSSQFLWSVWMIVYRYKKLDSSEGGPVSIDFAFLSPSCPLND